MLVIYGLYHIVLFTIVSLLGLVFVHLFSCVWFFVFTERRAKTNDWTLYVFISVFSFYIPLYIDILPNLYFIEKVYLSLLFLNCISYKILSDILL